MERANAGVGNCRIRAPSSGPFRRFLRGFRSPSRPSSAPFFTSKRTQYRKNDPGSSEGELRVQDARAGGAALGVVAEGGELEAQQRARAQAADVDQHAVAAVDVAARLRAVLLGVKDERLRGRGV